MGGKIVFLGCVFLLALTSGISQGQTGDVSALFEQAGKYEDDANFAAAEALYKQIVADYPQTGDGLEAKEKLTILYIEQDKSAEADAAFDEMVAVFSEFEGLAKAVDHVADAYRELKDYEQARDTYRYAVMSWPEAAHAADSQRAIALTSILLGDEPNGQAAINKLLSDFGSYPNIATVVDHLADDLRELKRYEQARRLYQHVVDNYPQADYALNCLGGVVRTSILLNDEPNAAAGTDRLFGEFAGRAGAAKAIDNIADCYRESARYEKARELYRYAIERWPEADGVMDSKRAVVLCSISLDDEPNAVSGIEQLVADHNESEGFEKVALEIGLRYERVKKRAEAKKVYESIVEACGTSRRADSARLHLAKLSLCEKVRDGDDESVSAGLEKIVSDYNDHEDLVEAVFVVGAEYYELSLRRKVRPTDEDYLRYKRNATKAIEVWKMIIDRGGDSLLNGWAYYFSAICYETLEEYDKAIDYFQIVLKDWPEWGKVRKAKFKIVSCYGRLISRGVIGRTDGEEEMEKLYGEIIAEEPGSNEAEIGKMWLKRRADGPFGMRRRTK